MGLIIVGIIVVVIFAFVSVYNSLIRLKNQIDRSWANIEVILKQRFDEIPQLIQILEQYVGYENRILTKLMEARKNFGAAQNVKDKMDSSTRATQAFSGLLALGESYPELKSNANFTQLQGRISDLENQLSDRRESYNETVTNFNTRIQQIPDVIVASALSYTPRELFKVSDEEKQKPSLKLNLPTG